MRIVPYWIGVQSSVDIDPTLVEIAKLNDIDLCVLCCNINERWATQVIVRTQY